MSAADWLTVEDVVEAYRRKLEGEAGIPEACAAYQRKLETEVSKWQVEWQWSRWSNPSFKLAEQGVLHAALSMINNPPPPGSEADHRDRLIKVKTEQFQSSGEPFPDVPSF